MIAAFACLAMLMAALAPSISHALSDPGNTRSLWTEICSTAGLKLVRVDLAQAEAPAHGEPASAFEHCPFCQPQGSMPALLPAAIVLPVTLAGFPIPSLYYQSPRPLFVWAGAQSRAPPVFS